MLAVVVFQLVGLFDDNPFTQVDVLVLLIAILLFLLFWVLRRVNFDEHNIYRVWGIKEKAVALSSIFRIERTGISLNNRKYWRVRYRDQDDQESKFIFLQGNFQSGSVKALMEAVKEVNPEVEIVESYIWNQWEHQKRHKTKRKEKKEAQQKGEA